MARLSPWQLAIVGAAVAAVAACGGPGGGGGSGTTPATCDDLVANYVCPGAGADCANPFGIDVHGLLINRLRATDGLLDFSHVEVVFRFHGVSDDQVTTDARHPRNNPDWPKVGIFAQRAKVRPNRIGVTTCPLLGVDGLRLRVRGLDAIDGTPVLDIKPYLREFAPRGATTQPAWATELMAGYW